MSARLWSRLQHDALIPVVNENEAFQTAAVALPSQDFTQGTKLHRDCLKAETIPKLQKEHYLFEKGNKLIRSLSNYTYRKYKKFIV